MSTLEVLVSTINDRIYDLEINDDYCYLIMHQISNNKQYDDVIFCQNNVRYFQVKGKGISRSRNLALEKSRGDIVWIMDDDASLHLGAKRVIVDLFEKYDPDMLVLKENCRRKLNSRKIIKHNLFTAISIISINMCISRKVISEGFRFDENFGLGTKRPSGEEYIFSTDLLKSGKVILQTDYCGVTHPDVSSGYYFYETDEGILTKFCMFDRVFGWFGFVVSLLFLMKKFRFLFKNRRLLHSLALYLRHYVLCDERKN
ncbi:glycosyltransferase [Vibrio sp. JC009]|uniref:glycosyltransferase n=1 Tax=Vibrio sp. JC009 TaxID=2912314 RepID=UPI0023B03064|nr:glycosyltransferase [Vibrio sp. JC009]WED22037.1 glycosyltransferase [Vibrio sp. JC009]